MAPIESDEWTYGELRCAVEAYHTRLINEAKNMAHIAFGQAHLMCALMNGKNPEIYEVFNVWSEDEVRQMKVAKIKRDMMRRVGR